MTEKEKAEAYDEALERARAINNGKDVDVESGTTICEYIFPELKESEDEKIRKEIISILRNTYWTSNRNRFNELVAWLENQGRNSTDKIEPKFKVGNWIISSVLGTARIIGVNNSNEFQLEYIDGIPFGIKE